MGSRIGSLAVLIVIAAIVVVVAFVISWLDLLENDIPDAPVIVVSLDDNALVLLDRPQSVTVTISSGHPIATLELFVDDESIISILPAYSAERGSWLGSFVWTPARLGFADLRVVALDDQGVESTRQVRVEVTDDQARVAAALRIDVLGISPLQQLLAGASVLIAVSATGNQPIERIEMFVDGENVASTAPVLVNGAYTARFEWIPLRTGEVEIKMVAIDAARREESQTIPVIVIPQSGVQTSSTQPERESSASTPVQAPQTQASDEPRQARIVSPDHDQRFVLEDSLSIDVAIETQGMEAVASALLYITPIGPDSSLGRSILVFSTERSDVGDFSTTVSDIQRWITESGAYQLQLVVFTPENDRYDDVVAIHIVASAMQPSADDEDPADEDAAVGDGIDLAIVTARQADDDRRQLNVTITNDSNIEVDLATVSIIVVEANDGSELASAVVNLQIGANALRTVPLTLQLEASSNVPAIVLIESDVDSDDSNNAFTVSLAPPPPEPARQDELEDEPDDLADPDALEQDDQEQALEDESVDEIDQSESSIGVDLAIEEVLTATDGRLLLRVVNVGDAPAASFSIVIQDADGEELEVVRRRDANTEPLQPMQSEILTSLIQPSGSISATVVIEGDIPESNLRNNTITLEIAE